MFIYFKAMKDGDIEPIVNFLIDGEYDTDYTQAVQPDFWGTEQRLYLL